MTRTGRWNWPEYLIEGWALGMFMLLASLVTAFLEYPASPLHQSIANPLARRGLIGLAMGITASLLIYSPWGQRSGAHMNPATTLTFWHLGKIAPLDASCYIAAQFTGALCGVVLAQVLLGEIIVHPSVNFVVTVPGPSGALVAFVLEAALSSGMMLLVLYVSNIPNIARFTGLFAGVLVFLYITMEAPYSGMSMNPARTVASAVPSGIWTASWVYLTAPNVGMLFAARIYKALARTRKLACPKLYHCPKAHCIFCGQAARGKTIVSERSNAASQYQV